MEGDVIFQCARMERKVVYARDASTTELVMAKVIKSL